MRKLFTKITAALAAAVMMLGSVPGVVHAEETYTINVSYHSGDTKIDGAEFTAVKAASVSSGRYTLVEPFTNADVDPNNLAQDNAQESAKTLAALYKEGGVKATTDTNGAAAIPVSEQGLYLVMQTGGSGTSAKYYYSSPMLVFVYGDPVTIEPKTSKKPDEPKKDNPPDTPETPETPSTPSTPSGSTGAIAVYKVDADNQNTYLQGAVFSLYKSDGTKVGTYTTDAKGYFGVTYLAYGNYYLIEDKAPDGYIGGTDKINFTLNSTTSYNSAYPWNIKITNTKKPDAVTPTPETPKDTPTPTQIIKTIVSRATGDASNLPLYCGIAAAALVGIVGFVIYKKKHN